MVELWVVFAVGLAASGVLLYLRTRRFLHILQLEEYYTREYARWLEKNLGRYLGVPLVVPLAIATGLAVVLVRIDWESESFGALDLAGVLLWALTVGRFAWLRANTPHAAKKPLVMTARARRLLIVSLALAAAVVALDIALTLLAGERAAIALGMVVATLAALFAGHFLLAANLALWPFEERSRRRFQSKAQRKLRERSPKVIAITGSAGKTTTKELVAHMLSARYRVLRTPSSFNTPMGISRTVNDALTDQEYFVVEMGAYTKGEIARLCRLVGGTDISVITTVNAQHLERFGSLEKTAEAKFEIVEGLKPGGVAVLNYDVAAIRQHADMHQGLEVFSFGIESTDVDLRATGVREQEGGIEVDVEVNGERTTVRTPLLGRHNANNVLAAVAVGLKCGLDLAYIAAALRQAHAPEHRLQPITLQTGGILLDDGYNANPQGIIGALEVLAAYAPKRRIVITPGLIEMGKDRAQYHEAIGKAAAEHVDVAFLVGPKQTADIRAGMLAAGFPEANVHTVHSLDEAREAVTAMGGWNAGNAVLIANDLPDQFDEMLEI
jgi:UDP-N-acetylmuramoyl-tripeptide--D-alanyl-D-alanine ligase